MIGAAVRHDQDLGPGFRQRFRHRLPPRILADRATDADPVHDIGAADRAGVEQAQFVEKLLVRQLVLEHLRRDPPALKDQIGVIQAFALGPRRADGQRRAVRAGGGKGFQRRVAVAQEGRFQHQVLGLVAGQEHLGQGHHVRARAAPLRPGVQRQRGVAGKVAHGRVQLGEGQAEAVDHGSILRGGRADDRAAAGRGKAARGAGAAKQGFAPWGGMG